ncbi:MAG: hypothetical protein RLZZ135_1611 [Cyanobacteriota bacterium]|jgi:hypothetical protein
MTTSSLQDARQNEIANQCQELATLITRHTEDRGNGLHPSGIDKLEFGRESNVSTSLRIETVRSASPDAG